MIVTMLRDGLYQVAYGVPDQAGGAREHFLASVRNGSIFGSDAHGGTYYGRDGTPLSGGLGLVQLACHIPPGGELVTGFEGGEVGAAVAVRGEFDPSAFPLTSVVDVGGAPVEIEINYLGPLPE